MFFRYDKLALEDKIDLDTAISSINFNDKELHIIELLKDSYTITGIGKKLGYNRRTVQRYNDRISKKIAKEMGVNYQNSRIIYLVEQRLKRKLTKEELDICCGVMYNYWCFTRKCLKE